MHDPMTVAFEIRSPFKRRSEFFPKGYRPSFITIWHKDPCKDGSDNSCDWFGDKKPQTERETRLHETLWHLETILDNSPYWPNDPAHLIFQQVKDAARALKLRSKWRLHPRWHIWHWRVQVIPFQMLWRWLFERCCYCKKGYGWNEQIMGNWGGTASWHFGCDKHSQKAPAKCD